KSLETGRREHKQIMVLNVAGITKLVRDVSRGNKSIAGLENKDLNSNGDLQFSGQDVVNLILTRMRMTRHTHPRCPAYLHQAVFSFRVYARQARRPDTYVEVIAIASRLIFSRWRAAVCVAVQSATRTGVAPGRCACGSDVSVRKYLSIL